MATKKNARKTTKGPKSTNAKGSIEQRSNGRWAARAPDSEARHVLGYFDTREEAQAALDKHTGAMPAPPAAPPLVATTEPAKPRTYNNPSIGVRLKAEDRAVIVREQEAMIADFPHLASVLELATTVRMLALEGAAARLAAREAKAKAGK
jgi:hypothetical protein